MRKTRQLSLKECYDILQIPKSATLDDVKKAYRKRAFELHPDLNPDSPHAGYQFQDLNEAYVALTHVLETEETKRQTAAAAAAAAEEKRQQEKAYKEAGRRAARQEKEREREAQAKEREEKAREREEKARARAKAQAEARAEAQARTEAEDWQKKREEAAEKMYAERQKASQAYAQEDVLRDLLHDPFARRVFEDIYSEVNRQEGRAAPSSEAQADGQDTAQGASTQQRESASEKSAQSTTQAGQTGQTGQAGQTQTDTSSKAETTKPSAKATPTPTAKVDLVEDASSSDNSFSSKIKGWFRHQIDDEQTIKMPAQTLFAGARIRLQIRRGLSEELSTVEITLPKEFVVGKPFRLRGLGKKVGKWQGDLYLTIQSK